MPTGTPAAPWPGCRVRAMNSHPAAAGSGAVPGGREEGGWLRPGPHLLAGIAVLLLGLYFSVGTAIPAASGKG